jgi:hypothetical protein
MTLVEDRNPFVFASVLPKIDYSDQPQARSGAASGNSPNDNAGPNERDKVSELFQQ